MATTGSWLMRNRARNRNHDSEWSFSCRTTPYNACYDSDSDTEQDNNISKISEEAQLLKELDLSAREETVQYKPNPFSIAKINAASRGLSTKERTSNESPSRTQRPSIRPSVAIIDRNKKKKDDKKTRPGASILDKLKKQSQKATLDSNLKKAVPVASFSSPVPSNASVPIFNSSISKSFDPLLTSDVNVEVSRPFHAVETNNAPAAMHVPPSDGPAHVIHMSSTPESSKNTHITSNSTQISSSVPPHQDSSSQPVPLEPLEDDLPAAIEDAFTEKLADIEHDTFDVALPQNPDSDVTLIDADPFAPSAPLLAQSPNYSEGLPLAAQQRRDLLPSLNFNSPRTSTMKSTFNSKLTSIRSAEHRSRPRPLSLSSPPQQQHARTPALSSFTASSRFRPAAMSSPLRPVGPRDMSRMPIFSSHVATDASLDAPFSYKPLGNIYGNPSSPITIGRDPSTISVLVHSTDNDHLEESAPSPSHIHEVEDVPNYSPFSSSSRANPSPLSRFTTPLRKIIPCKTMKTSQLGETSPSGSGTGDHFDDFVKPGNAIVQPEDNYYHASQGLMTPTEPACVLPLSPDSVVYYSGTNHKRPHSPCRGSGMTKARPRPMKDAYDFLSSDPDENWGTLPIRKKVKISPNPVIRSRKFRLPNLGLGNSKNLTSLKTEKTGMEANSPRRVITFLPPPLKPASTRLESDSKVVLNRVGYPSPSYPALKLSSSPMHERPTYSQNQHQSPAEGTGTKAYKPLSPPPSDPPCVTPDLPAYNAPIEVTEDVECQSDVHRVIDLPSIARLYPDMKAKWRQRRKSFEEIWNILDLPSCGRVYCDKTSDIGLDEGEFQEIGIVKFRGVDSDHKPHK